MPVPLPSFPTVIDAKKSGSRFTRSSSVTQHPSYSRGDDKAHLSHLQPSQEVGETTGMQTKTFCSRSLYWLNGARKSEAHRGNKS